LAVSTISRMFSDRWVCIHTVGCSASTSPAMASCSSLQLIAKRGVTA
jgi:hypothetical protein